MRLVLLLCFVLSMSACSDMGPAGSFAGYVLVVRTDQVLVSTDTTIDIAWPGCQHAHYYGLQGTRFYQGNFAAPTDKAALAVGQRVLVHGSGSQILSSCPDQSGAAWIVILD